MTNSAGGTLVENEVDAGILKLTINRPEKKNALTREMSHFEIARAFHFVIAAI